MEKMITSLPILVSAIEDSLHEYNYRKSTMGQFKKVWVHLDNFMQAKGKTCYTPVVGLDFLHTQLGYPCSLDGKHSRKEQHWIRGVRLLNDYQSHGTISALLPRGKVKYDERISNLIEEFVDYSYEKNHVKGTITTQLQGIERFLKLAIIQNGLTINQITPQVITEYVAGLAAYSQSTVKIRLVALRFFFNFLYDKNHTSTNMSEYVPYVKGAKSERIPSALGESELKRLLEVVDRGSPIGKRDYAILVIAAFLGMRDGDIADLTFENLDWESGYIEFVQMKTKEPVRLPLLPTVGDALIDYLKHGRPQTGSVHVFVSHKVPFKEMKSFYGVMVKHMNAAGIKTHVNALRGLHVLRHTLASGLIKQGESYQTVSAVLGHVSSSSTDTYAHIDIDGLLQCALDVSEVTGYA